jgi:predicted GIY-YIG superfamily endonuclease
MTIGIYRLIFPNTDKCYIGQSVNIERRYLQHLRDMEKGTAARKMQHAYSIYG